MEILIIPVFAILAADLYCAWKESEITAKYAAFNVYGKFKAYIFTNFICVAIVGIILFICSITSKLESAFAIVGTFLIIIGVAISSLVYRSAKSKCPDGPLKDKLMINMIISGFGSSFKSTLFFLNIFAKVFEPKKYVDEDGRNVYVHIDDKVYDERGNLVGKKTDSNTYIRTKR